MSTILKSNKKFRFIDFLIIPLTICPFLTTINIIIKVLIALMPSFQVFATAKFIDTAIAIFNGETNYQEIYIPLILLTGIIVFTYLSSTFLTFITLKINMKMTEIFKTEMITKRAKLKYTYIEDNDTWDLISRTCNDPVAKIIGGFDNLIGAADIFIRVMSLLTILMAQVWWAGLVIICITVPLFFIAIKGGKASYTASKEAEKHNRRAAYLHEVLSQRENVAERSVFNYSENINQKWLEKFEIARKINLKVDLKYFIKMKGSSLITILISLVISGVLLVPLSQGKITPGMFMGLVTGSLNLIQMMSWNLSYITNQLAKNTEYLKDLTAFSKLEEQDGALDKPIADNPIQFETIEFKNVSFKYPNTEKYILKNFNLKLLNHLHYAFVGVNGAGKTTLTKLLTGMYDNFEGEILINNRSIREYQLSELKALFAVVYQDFAKYYIKAKDNIALGNVNQYDDHKIKESASVIGLDETIDNLKDGLETYLGKIHENGVDLSGGEWQRFAIARALYNPAQIRILDEPTAALDPVAESNIYEMFGKISASKSTIFITHRLGAARLADEIIVIDNGAVAEKGDHNTLMQLGGIYSEMFESQRSWYN